jgi:hyperosmotically inducible protein
LLFRAQAIGPGLCALQAPHPPVPEAVPMQKKSSRLPTLMLAIALVAPLVLVGCGKTVGDTIDDATITTRVKTSLLNDPLVGGLRIDVDTFKGAVTLSGRVKSKEEETQAVALARRIDGVTGVKSTLQILP